MKWNKLLILIGSFLILPSTVLASADASCSALPAAHQAVMDKLNAARTHAVVNDSINGETGIYSVAAQYALTNIDSAINKLQGVSGSLTPVQTGYYPGHAYLIHNAVKTTQSYLWTSNHWAAISFVYDKDVSAKLAMNEGLTAKSLLADMHTLSLKCYVHDTR